MLRYILINIFTLLFFVSGMCAQNSLADGVKAYQEENYDKAVDIFEQERKELAEKGLESSDVYYNLGNAYFRNNDIAKAVLNYERANLINPGDRDVRHNLDFVRTQTEDKIDGIDAFFLQSWFDAVQNLQSSNAWAKLSIVIFLIFIISLAVFFFSHRIVAKKITFYLCIIFVVLLIVTNVFSFRLKDKILNRDSAIIMVGVTPILSSPDSNSSELFLLHAGTKVKINKTDGSWLEIEIDNGNVGWIKKEKLYDFI